MANNRGGIPMYNENSQYSATISSQLPQGSPAMFGTQVAKERAGLGDAMTKLGTTVVDWAVKMQEREDNAYLLRRDNEMRQQLNDLLYNPTNGLANQKGHNAQGVTGMFDEEVEKLTQQFMSDVGNPNMQAKFQERVAQWLPGYRKNIAVHEGDEIFKANTLDIDTSIKDKVDSALRKPNANSANILYTMLRQNVDDLQNLNGMSKEAAEEYVQGKYSTAILQMAEGLAKTSDTFNIMGIYDAVKDKVTGEVYNKIGAMVGVAKIQDKGKQIAQVYYNDPSMWSTGVVGQGVFLKNKAMKAAEEDLTETENVFVADGNADFSDLNTNNPDVGRIWDWFIAHGYSPEATAGIMGRMQQEHNFQTSDVPLQYIEGIGEVGGLGMFQFTKGRAEAFRKWAGENGYSTDSALAQLEYMYNIDRPNQSFTGHTFDPAEMNQLDRYGAAKLWTDSFERGATGEENRYADELFSKHSGRPATGGHYEKRTKDNRVLLQAIASQFDTMAASSQDDYNQTKEYYKKQLSSDPEIAAGTASPAAIKAKMSALGMDSLPIDMQREIYGSVSFPLSVNQAQQTVDDKAKARAYQQANDACYEWMYNIIANGGTVTAEAFKEQNFPMSPQNKFSILATIEKAEASGNNPEAWYKGDNQYTFEKEVSRSDFGFSEDEKVNLRQKLTSEQARRMKVGEAPLTSKDVRSFIFDQSMTREINAGWGSQTVKRSQIPEGYTETSYGVLDPEGNTVKYDEETERWIIRNFSEDSGVTKYEDGYSTY